MSLELGFFLLLLVIPPRGAVKMQWTVKFEGPLVADSHHQEKGSLTPHMAPTHFQGPVFTQGWCISRDMLWKSLFASPANRWVS
jgi:hypothetical protein